MDTYIKIERERERERERANVGTNMWMDVCVDGKE